MRHKASGPFADFLHRLSRAAAIRLEAAAEGLPVRALTTLAVVTGLGIGGYVALSPVMGGPSTGQSEVAVDAAATDAEESTPTTQAPAPDDSRGAEPGASASGQPQAPPPPTSDLTPPTSTDPDEATGSPRTETPTPSPSPPESQPSPDRPRPKKDDTPPDTSLSEEYPDPDAALFLLSATEDASFICSLDEGLYAPCDSPQLYSDLHPGWHTFAVRAVDSAGNTDPSPAETRWLATGTPSADEQQS